MPFFKFYCGCGDFLLPLDVIVEGCSFYTAEVFFGGGGMVTFSGEAGEDIYGSWISPPTEVFGKMAFCGFLQGWSLQPVVPCAITPLL